MAIAVRRLVEAEILRRRSMEAGSWARPRLPEYRGYGIGYAFFDDR